jgi:hypothetical protein
MRGDFNGGFLILKKFISEFVRDVKLGETGAGFLR